MFSTPSYVNIILSATQPRPDLLLTSNFQRDHTRKLAEIHETFATNIKEKAVGQLQEVRQQLKGGYPLHVCLLSPNYRKPERILVFCRPRQLDRERDRQAG